MPAKAAKATKDTNKSKNTKDSKSSKDSSKSKSTSTSTSKSAAGKDSSATKQKGAQSINVRHILCEKHARKEEALTKLRDGSKFDEVAREFSEDKARQGGSLGWKSRGSLLAEFEAVAFELEVSSTSSPKWAECKTSEGYHIVMVEGRK